jgi:multisubunit Na+/H+ antiporter MnhE subunit
MRGRAAAAIAALTVLTAVEMLLVGKIDPQETPVGIAIAALAAFATIGALAAADVRYAVPVAAFAQFPRIAGEVVRDTFVVTGALLRALRGQAPDDALEELPFDPGGDDAAAAARGALTIAGTSAAPNSIVVDVDPERRTMLVHRLAR